MTRVLVCGGRNFRSPAQVWRELDRLHAERKFTHLIQGGATGADKHAKDWATTKREIERFESKAKWEDLSHPDAVIRIASGGVARQIKDRG